MSESKNAKIKSTIHATRLRRQDMVCRTYEVKIVRGKLSHYKKEWLDSLFLEGKWLRNSELAKDDLSLLDRNAKTATVLVGDSFDVRELTHLGSQMRQDIVDQIKTDINALAEKKKNGYKVGALKFKAYCNMIPLRQYGTTFRIDFDKNTISIQKCKKPFKVRGLKQIPKDCEIANAKLIRKPSGYYFHITTYQTPEPARLTGKMCGTDFGIKNNITLSSGEKYDISIPESHAIKIASKRVNKSFCRNGKKKSKKHTKRVATLQRAYEKNNNKKRDRANKVTHALLSTNDIVAMQDELIAAWHHGLFGKQVQHSAMGSIKANLKRSSKVLVVPASFPSTQLCPVCGGKTKHKLSQREYECGHCGWHHPDRDVKAAEMVLIEALRNASNYTVSLERRTKSPVEVATPGICLPGEHAAHPGVKLSPAKREAQGLSLG